MPINVIYPKVSLESAFGKIAQWLVAEGDRVQQGQILFEIENDKAAVEVESPGAGIIRQLAPTDTELAVGGHVALIYAAGETPDAPPASAGANPTPPATGETPDVQPAGVPMAAPPPVAFASAPHRADASSPNPTPLARRIARSENISLAGLTGTGPRGRIQKKDVLAQLAALAAMPGAISGGEPVPALHPGLRAADTLHSAWLRQGSGAPLVLLHGFSADLNNWRGLFAGARFDAPVLALDLPAHGQSAHSLAPDFDALCAQVEAAIAALVAGPLVLAGHSFGGAVAARLAARGVLDLRGLCLFAPAGLGPDINGGFTEGVLRAREAASLLPWLRELVDDPAIISEAFLRAVVEQRRDTGLTAAMQAFAERFFPDGTQTVTIRRDLAGLTLPARVVFGRNDRILPFAATRHLPGTVGLHALDACGHMPHLEHPALARRILSELLRGV